MSRFEKVNIKGVVNSGNSTSTPLGGGGVFTGTAVEILNYGIVFVSVYADVASATDGLSIQQSIDGTNWDFSDNYTITAGGNENYSVNPHARYLRVVYTNGGGAQSAFRLQTILKGNAKPSSHRLEDTVTTQDDAELVKSVIAYRKSPDVEYYDVDVQSPLPVDGDFVYSKDVWEDESDMGDFSGSVSDLFDNLHSVIVDSTANNPKEIFIHFNRTIVSNVIGIGAYSGDFSNTKVYIVTSGAVEVLVFDESGDGTKYTTRTIQLPITAGFNAIKIQFHTADTVTLSNFIILKTRSNVSRLQAAKPDNTVTDINATTGGNLKISLEEVESGISSNSNSQLNVTPFHADGTEGALISGVNYESGKSGIDASTEVLESILYEHHEIHSGSNYEVTNVVDLAINNVRDIRITTPNTTEYGHFIFRLMCESETEYYLYEGVTIVTAGTSITPLNNNRNSVSTSSMTVDYIDNTSVANANADTTVAGSTTIKHGIIGAGKDGGEDAHDRETILKANTVYCLRMIANAAGYVNYDLSWYEHTDKN